MMLPHILCIILPHEVTLFSIPCSKYLENEVILHQFGSSARENFLGSSFFTVLPIYRFFEHRPTHLFPEERLHISSSKFVVGLGDHPTLQETRGQWPFRLWSTRAMANLSSHCGGFRGLSGLQTSSKVQIDLRFETSDLDYPSTVQYPCI